MGEERGWVEGWKPWHGCFLNFWFLKKTFIKPRPNVRFFTHFLAYIIIISVHVYFVVLTLVTNFAFCIAPIYPPEDARWLPWFHFDKWPSLYYQHKFELSTVNSDYLGSLEGTGRNGLVLEVVTRLTIHQLNWNSHFAEFRKSEECRFIALLFHSCTVIVLPIYCR